MLSIRSINIKENQVKNNLIICLTSVRGCILMSIKLNHPSRQQVRVNAESSGWVVECNPKSQALRSEAIESSP